jgi:hypothetical protein
MLCYVMLCYVMLCYVMLCYVMCGEAMNSTFFSGNSLEILKYYMWFFWNLSIASVPLKDHIFHQLFPIHWLCVCVRVRVCVYVCEK